MRRCTVTENSSFALSFSAKQEICDLKSMCLSEGEWERMGGSGWNGGFWNSDWSIWMVYWLETDWLGIFELKMNRIWSGSDLLKKRFFNFVM